MERIVVGFDGTSAARAALTWVAARSRLQAVRVDVVSVREARRADDGATWAHLAEAETYFRDHAPYLAVDLHRLSGDVGPALAHAAAAADLLVVGVHPGHPLRAMLAGAVPLRVSARSSVPTVAVPAGWTESREPVTVGIASDDSSTEAVGFAAEQAERYGVGLCLVHAWRVPVPDVTSEDTIARAPEEARNEHQALLDRAVTAVTGAHPHLEVVSRLIRDDRGPALLGCAPESSMLVIGTHRHGVLAWIIVGAVAQEVLWRSHIPVAIVPRPSDATTEGAP